MGGMNNQRGYDYSNMDDRMPPVTRLKPLEVRFNGEVIDRLPARAGALYLPAGAELFDPNTNTLIVQKGPKPFNGTYDFTGGTFYLMSEKFDRQMPGGQLVAGPDPTASPVRPALGNDPTHSPFLHSVDAKTLSDQATLYFKDSDTWEDSTLAKEAEEADKPDDLYGRLRY